MARLVLYSDYHLAGTEVGGNAELDPPSLVLTPTDVEMASKAWQAYRSCTTERWVGPLRDDLSGLPGFAPRRVATEEVLGESSPRLTAFGEAILLGREDFSLHNSIHRWWGGSELTNANLWRWDPITQVLIAP